MLGCEDCGHFVPDPSKAPDGVMCDVDADTLDPETLERFNLAWNSDGEKCDCPCAIDRKEVE